MAMTIFVDPDNIGMRLLEQRIAKEILKAVHKASYEKYGEIPPADEKADQEIFDELGKAK